MHKLIAGLFAVILISCLGYANWPDKQVAETAKADKIVIEKSARLMTLYHEGKAIASYHVSLGRSPVGPKTREGDK